MFVLVYISSLRFVLIRKGPCWFAMVCVGSQWFVLVCNGLCWFAMVRVGSHWFVLVRNSLCWFAMVRVGSQWFVFVCNGSCLLARVRVGSQLFVLVRNGSCWFAMVRIVSCLEVKLRCLTSVIHQRCVDHSSHKGTSFEPFHNLSTPVVYFSELLPIKLRKALKDKLKRFHKSKSEFLSDNVKSNTSNSKKISCFIKAIKMILKFNKLSVFNNLSSLSTTFCQLLFSLFFTTHQPPKLEPPIFHAPSPLASSSRITRPLIIAIFFSVPVQI